MGEQGYGIDAKRVADYAEQIKAVAESGVQVAIVIGGGNIFRGFIAGLQQRPHGHHAGDDGVVDAGQLQAAQGELGEQHLMELVGGVCRAGGDCPAHPHLAVLEEACGGLGVADVDCKKHGIPPGGAARVHVGSMVPHDGSSTVTKPLREGARMTQ